MNVIAYSNAFGHFAEMIEKVCDDHAPVVIIRDFQTISSSTAPGI